jgi:hypothetical protein
MRIESSIRIYLDKAFRAAALAAIVAMAVPAVHGQDRTVSLGVKWLRVGDLHNTFAIEGAEFEMHRTGMLTEQCDGLRWPAQFRYQDCSAAKTMWIGCTNFMDPVKGLKYPYKVVGVGPRLGHPTSEIMPASFKLLGRFRTPDVTVDVGDGPMDATEMKLNDVLDADPDTSLLPDRLIVHELRTSIGLTVVRKLMAFSQQNHSNYFIYEYTLKNTGIIDLKGTEFKQKLTGVVLQFNHRYAVANEAFKRGWRPDGNTSWGRNTINDVVGTDPTAPGFEFRALFAYYGPHSASNAMGFDDWGEPDWMAPGPLGSARMAGVVVLHADRSAADKSDDLNQPTSTQFMGSDTGPLELNQYDPSQMSRKYVDYMTKGHPAQTHAQAVGDGYANLYGNDAGGFTQDQAFGPWDLEVGDSVQVVIAEGVAGLDRKTNLEVGENWFRHWKGLSSDPMKMPGPGGTETTDFNAYKKAWVWTAKDSLFKTFRNAIRNYNDYYGNGRRIPQPPFPPEKFEVKSAADRISLSWTGTAAEACAHFNGYRVYRAAGKPDTLCEMVFDSDTAEVKTQFDDMTAARQFDYYYYVVSKDDGSQNDLYPGVPLESSKFYTMTSEPARLMRPGIRSKKGLDRIVVVPNPYDVRAKSIQFGENQPDQIVFLNLPPKCIIRIFTERGDLVKKIDHTNQSGDERWDCLTEYKQVVVSGLYVAHFEVTEDVQDLVTKEVVMSKGDKAFRKFIIIR